MDIEINCGKRLCYLFIDDDIKTKIRLLLEFILLSVSGHNAAVSAERPAPCQNKVSSSPEQNEMDTAGFNCFCCPRAGYKLFHLLLITQCVGVRILK